MKAPPKLGLCLVLWLCLVAVLAAPPAHADAVPIAEQKASDLDGLLAERPAYALIIGISDYDDPVWRDLDGVAEEIAVIREALEGKQGFTVVEPAWQGRLTADELRTEIERFVRAYGGDPSARLVLYFATHGLADESGQGRLIASDSTAPGTSDFVRTTFSVDQLETMLANARSRHMFLFFNACFGAAMVPFGGDGTRGPQAELVARAERLLAGEARMVLTAGNALQEVPDRANPFAKSVAAGLGGAADLDGDGMIVGIELAQYVRTEVARATLASHKPNDPVLALLSGGAAADTGSGAIDGDYVFRAPAGPRPEGTGPDEAALLAARQKRLPGGQFTECADCPVMVTLPRAEGQIPLALARTETSYAEWDACYRSFLCSRYLPDGGLGRGDRPVAGVTWQDAREFVAWANAQRRGRCDLYRLPTAEEWRLAAGTPRPDRAVCADCADLGGLSSATALRGGNLPGTDAAGLQDMGGNLWEWTGGLAGAEDCPLSPALAADGCATDGLVIGGAYSTAAAALPLAFEGAAFPRTGNARSYSLPTIGFRLACDIAQ